MTVHYMILCHARTGSNFLVNALAQHPAITAHNELFHERTIYLQNQEITSEDILAKRNADPVAFLLETMAQAKTPVWGFKHLLFYAQPIIDYVMTGDCHLILLERENVLAQYSSFAIAHQTKQWTLHQNDKKVSAEKLAWDEADFEAYCQQYQAVYRDLKQTASKRDAPVLHVRYSELFKPPTVPAIYRFLGVEPIRPQTTTIRKQNTSHITDRYYNPDIVLAYLARSGHPEWAIETL